MNVILIPVDTLRAQNMSCYGYKRRTTPNIDRLAKEGVLFERAYAPDIPTQPAYTNIHTGLYGIQHGVVSNRLTADIHPSIPSIGALLKRRGIVTAHVGWVWINHCGRSLIGGFKYIINPMKFPRTPPPQPYTAEDVNSLVIPWLKTNYEKPFFLHIHYWDPHAPYFNVPEQFKRRFYEGDEKDKAKEKSLQDLRSSPYYPNSARWQHLEDEMKDVKDLEYHRALYDSSILYVDEKIGELIEVLCELGIEDETIIIITSDHGEALGEHGLYFDHHGLYENIVHIPLILWAPGRLPAGKRISNFVEHVDIAPTVLKIFGEPIPEKMAGQDLLGLIQDKQEKRRDFVVLSNGCIEAKRGIRTQRWKLIKSLILSRDPFGNPPIELYDLQKDPNELTNVAEEKPEIANQLELRLTRWVDKHLEGPDPLRAEIPRIRSSWLWQRTLHKT